MNAFFFSLDAIEQRTASSGASADTDRAGNASDEDSDSELQQVYVQAYACKIFNDGAAAGAVESGEHLRPLAVPQVVQRAYSSRSLPFVYLQNWYHIVIVNSFGLIGTT